MLCMKNYLYSNLTTVLSKLCSNAKFRLGVVLIALMSIVNIAVGQSNHTVTFTGNLSDFNTAEQYVANSGQTTWGITFDATNLYIGAFRVGTSSNSGDNMAIYINTTPNSTLTTGNGTTGTTTGYLYNGVTGTLPFAANYTAHVQYGTGGTYSNYYELKIDQKKINLLNYYFELITLICLREKKYELENVVQFNKFHLKFNEAQLNL